MRQLIFVFGLCLATFAFGARAVAAPPAKPTENRPDGKSLDDALLEDLDNELLEGAGELKSRPATKDASQRPADTPKADDQDDGMAGSDEDPLQTIGQEMRSVESLIPQAAKRPHAEQLQERIIMDLAQLIEQAQQQRARQQAGQSKKSKQQTNKRQSVQQSKPMGGGKAGKDSNQPAKDSTDRLGKSEDARPDPEVLRGMMKDTWGHLPARAREQMLQNSPERFLPRYEIMLERYYKRLAEQQDGK